MLDIVIYKIDKNYVERDVNAINFALADFDMDYRIHKFDNYSDNLDKLIHNKNGNKIYVLDIGMDDGTGLEIASRIRKFDWDSIIIYVNICNKYHNDIFCNKLLVLDFIYDNNQYEEKLIDDIKVAIKIIYKKRTFVFKYNHLLYRVPYSDICYIEKEPLIKRCIIHTLNDKLYVVNSINKLNEILGSDFIKTHQSCIVNKNNIKKVDLSNNIIVFENEESTSLLSTKIKRELMSYMEVN